MVCDEIKASCMAKVAGTFPERMCYRLLNLIAFVAFLAAVAGVFLKAKDPITEVEVEALDVFPWPVLFFCYFDKEPNSPSVNEALNLEMKAQNSCTKNDATVWTLDLASDASAAPVRTCLTLKDRANSDLVKDLETRFQMFSKDSSNPNGKPWQCFTFNEDGQLASSADTYKEVQHEWYTTLQAGHEHDEEFFFAWSGILDPKLKTFAEQKDSFTYFMVPFVNANSQLTFTVDKHVEKDWTNIFTSTEIGERVKVVGEAAMEDRVKEYMKDDAVKLKYNPAFNTKPMSPMTSVGREQRSKLTFHPLNYVSRTVTKRYKTWDEIWGGIGGAWAAAVLLITVFFVQKEVQVPPQHPVKHQNTGTNNTSSESSGKAEQQEAQVMEEVQVFRLRGATSKEEAVKTVFAMAVDAFDAGRANNEAVEPASKTEV